ncbi:hypothetical protein BCL57_000873 [Agromyces flavus]|uniref:Putative auto-transporter adhesin, head GIN domain n=1 Tax=Agromyces flavus TaxID=589382 RepID=A0A1H1YLL5_9MICO|nr:head GIN domain-containing protein [Agromyces flavus]MCP2366731.1 hypothetical protein [Agromyces flavus]GGI45259.1 DUF2807 domain-containing protein [Agromyces flavus]SDT22245.1 Putative auto-transporter adhesin, head GIN domain [Agromyces flavus]
MSSRRVTVPRAGGAVAVAASMLVLTACVPFVTAGDRRTEDRDIDDATEVELRSGGDLTIRLGDEPSFTVTGGENVLDRLYTDTEGDKLVIEMRRGPLIVGERDLEMDVTVTSLDSVIINGSGDISAEFGDAEEVSVDLRGSGDIETDELDASAVRLSISGSGQIETSGSTDQLVVDLSGSGDVDASELSSANAQVVLSGSGEISVDASDSLDVTLSGSGTVRYSGRPEVRSTVSGSGEITPE